MSPSVASALGASGVTRPRRIVFLLSSLNAGGAERVATGWVNYWANQGHEVILVPCYSQGSGQSFYPITSTVRVHWLARDLPSVRYWASAVKPWVLRRRLRQWQPDVVVSFLSNVNCLALMATAGLSIPCVVCERTDPVATDHLPWLLRILRHHLYPRADVVTVQTQASAEALAAAMPKLKRIVALPNPVPEALVAALPQQVRGEEGSTNDHTDAVAISRTAVGNEVAKGNRGESSTSTERIVLGLGRLVPQKRFDVVIDAFATIAADFPQWQLHLYGQGPQAAVLKTQIEAHGLADKIILKGVTTTPWEVMQKADLFVMSSAREGFPNAMLEAMANGLASIVVDCPFGPAELSRDGEVALLLPDKSSEGSLSTRLAQAMAQMMRDEAARQRLARAGQQHVLSHYRMARLARDWDDLFDSVIPHDADPTQTTTAGDLHG